MKLTQEKKMELKTLLVLGEKMHDIAESCSVPYPTVWFYRNSLVKAKVLKPLNKTYKARKSAKKVTEVTSKVELTSSEPVNNKVHRFIINGMELNVNGASKININKGLIDIEI
jgi:hypothetical protein